MSAKPREIANVGAGLWKATGMWAWLFFRISGLILVFYLGAHITLPAGTTWVMGYAMDVYAWTGSTGLPGTGSGSLAWEITPEPASLFLLALPLVALTRRPRLRLTANS